MIACEAQVEKGLAKLRSIAHKVIEPGIETDGLEEMIRRRKRMRKWVLIH